MPPDFLKTVLLPLALIIIMFGMGMTLRLVDFRRVLLAPKGTLALAIALGLLDSARIAMPAVCYSLFMFASGAFMIARNGRRPVAVA